MTTDEMIEVLRAKEAGKKVECRPKYYTVESVWSKSLDSSCNFALFDYRIIKEPAVAWMNEYVNGKRFYHHTEDEAIKSASHPSNDRVAIRVAVKMVEVFE